MSPSQESENGDEAQRKLDRRAGLRRWLRGIVFALIGLVIAAHAIGFLFPAEYVVTRSAKFTQSAEDLWPLISNIEADPEWRPSILGVRVNENSESGTAFDSLREYDGISCIGTERITEMDPPWRLVRTLNGFPDEPSGIWTLELSPVADGTELTVTARLIPDRHPVMRLYRRVSSKAEDQVDSYLLWGKSKVNTPVQDVRASPPEK